VFENAGKYLKFEAKTLSVDDRPMFSPSLVKFGQRTTENRPEKCPPKKLGLRKCAKFSLIQR